MELGFAVVAPGYIAFQWNRPVNEEELCKLAVASNRKRLFPIDVDWNTIPRCKPRLTLKTLLRTIRNPISRRGGNADRIRRESYACNSGIGANCEWREVRLIQDKVYEHRRPLWEVRDALAAAKLNRKGNKDNR
ncbi:MAG: hypothetical protein F4X44_05885 [Gammaproteobacteria bacterium]|nr:hypothetical protein [Gammaproteobacteria bacterium]MYD80122.1 hypothetical protein [Gammaproteobacteria bacterium]